MTIALTTALVLLTAGFLILLDRKDKRQQRERQELYQRIQAPREAIIERQLRDLPPSPPAVHWDDDEDYHSARGLTKEQLAEQAYDAG